MTSTKIQINYNIQKFNNQNSFGHLVIDIWNLFVICNLLFVIFYLPIGSLIQNLFDFMDKHYIIL
ncbi:hypothetical protein ES705_27001 [subsurface metagenome]